MNDAFRIALSQYGVKEISGTRDNPVIVDYFSEIGHSWVEDDETPWCAAFANWCLHKAGLEHTGALNARSFLNYGEETDQAQVGDIVVFWRSSPDSWKGHVGFYINEDDHYINVLGGNQENMVTISQYPKSRLLGYRRILNS